jgi:hypothetical protein
MKIWGALIRNPANKCRESCALWSSFPVACVSKMLLGKLLENNPMPCAWRFLTEVNEKCVRIVIINLSISHLGIFFGLIGKEERQEGWI